MSEKTLWDNLGITNSKVKIPIDTAGPDAQPSVTMANPSADESPSRNEVVHRKNHIILHLNSLYGTAKVHEDWKSTTDMVFNGTITPIASQRVLSQILTANQLGGYNIGDFFQVMQYPGAPFLYLVLREFQLCPSATTMTGNLTMQFEDSAGKVVPLGVMSATGASSSLINSHSLIPTPIMDPQIPALGNVVVTLNGATPVACNYQIAFSIAYVLPNMEAFSEAEITGHPKEKHSYAVDRAFKSYS